MFAQAVERAMTLTNQKDTLIIVTGDHSHVFNIAGYAEIDNDILGTYRADISGLSGFHTLAFICC